MEPNPDGDAVLLAAGRIRSAKAESERRQVATLRAVAARLRAGLQAEREPLLVRARGALRVGAPPSLRALVGIRHREVPMNRVLGWLLDPSESHGLGVLPLRAVASLLRFDELREDLDRGVDVEVLVESAPTASGREPDLLVRTRGAALLLENKVHAGESGEDQYSDYLAILDEFAEGRVRRAHLLARDNRVREPGWAEPVTHRELASALAPIARDAGLPVWPRAVVALVCVDLLDVDPCRILVEVGRLERSGARSPGALLELSRYLDLLEDHGLLEVFRA